MLFKDEIVDKYTVLRLVGSGGTSDVYEVKQNNTGMIFAMKEKKCDVTDNEVEFLARFNHPSIPRLIDIVDYKGNKYIVMDYISGTRLDNYARMRNGLDEKECIKIGQNILDCLEYLHNQNPPVIYRDLKPSNVIVDDVGRIYLVDYNATGEKSLNGKEQSFYVSKKYASPEILNGMSGDERSDIYSFGKTMESVMKKDTSVGMKKFMGKCTENEPNLRYDGAKNAMKALEKIGNENRLWYDEKIKKIKLFMITLLMCLTFLGFLINTLAKTAMQKEKVESGILNGNEEYSTEERKEILTKMIREEKEAYYYEILLEEMASDRVLDINEVSLITTLFKEGKNELEKVGQYDELLEKAMNLVIDMYEPIEKESGKNENEDNYKKLIEYDRKCSVLVSVVFIFGTLSTVIFINDKIPVEIMEVGMGKRKFKGK